ncbi:MAG: pyridoxal phosphate-dependent aminotransferase, partial [Candidatus Thorarchaeota archaeon]
SFAAVISYMNAKGVPIPLKEENEFRLDPDDIEAKITPQTRLIIVNSPMNPTGSMMTKEELARVAELAEEHEIYVLGDEIYSKMTYDRDFFSVSMRDQAKNHSVIIDGFSKAYSMTGWRLGYMIGPENLIDRSGLLLALTVSCVSSFSQKAGVAALKEPQTELNRMMAIFRKRRDRIVMGLNEVPGFNCKTPEGAFYAFPNIQQTGMTSRELANQLLMEIAIACIPGTLFGPNGEGYLRFSYATSIKVIDKAIERMKAMFS